MKVLTILGTRPEIIRLSRTIAKLDELCEHVVVHTGQNHDFNLNDIFFSSLVLENRIISWAPKVRSESKSVLS